MAERPHGTYTRQRFLADTLDSENVQADYEHGDIAEVCAAMRHESATTTLSVYVHEFNAAARSDERRARYERLYGSAAEAQDHSNPQHTTTPPAAEVGDLQAKRDSARRTATGDT